MICAKSLKWSRRMKEKLHLIGVISIIILILVLIICGEIRVQKNWDKYEENVMIERGIENERL